MLTLQTRFKPLLLKGGRGIKSVGRGDREQQAGKFSRLLSHLCPRIRSLQRRERGKQKYKCRVSVRTKNKQQGDLLPQRCRKCKKKLYNSYTQVRIYNIMSFLKRQKKYKTKSVFCSTRKVYNTTLFYVIRIPRQLKQGYCLCLPLLSLSLFSLKVQYILHY